MNLLPLRLTPFEESLWVDDHPAYPWNILFRLQWAGRCDRATFERALAATVARHPFFTARVRRRWMQRWFWETINAKEAAARPRVHWNEHKPGTWPTPPKLRLEAGESLEIRVAAGDAETEILLNFHHVAVDGLGALQFINDLLTAYDAFAQGKPQPAWRSIDSQQLRRRGTYGYTVGKWLQIAPKLRIGLAGVRQFLQRRPVPITPHQAVPRDQPLPTDYPALRSHTFTVEQTAQLLTTARRRAVTLNDLLTRDLFLTLHPWCRARGATVADEWLRLLVPISMRTAADDALPAANLMSTIFLDRRPSDSADPEALLQTLHDEMMLIKRNHLELIYLIMLRLSAIVPGFMAWGARRQKFTCSAVLSNVLRPLESSPLPRTADGRLLVAGIPLTALEFFPPFRPFTCAAFGIATYAGRLTLTLNADPRFLSVMEIDRLLDLYAAQVATALTTPGG